MKNMPQITAAVVLSILCVVSKASLEMQDTDILEIEDERAGLLKNHQWVLGMIYVVAGPLIALFGKALFPYMTATLSGIFTMVFCNMYGVAHDWTLTDNGCIKVFVGSIIIGIVVGLIVRRSIWLMVGFLGFIAGMLFGNLLLITACVAAKEATWCYWTIVTILAICGCF